MSKTIEDLLVIILMFIIYMALLTVKTAIVYAILNILAISTSFSILLILVATVEMVGVFVESILSKLVVKIRS